MKQRVKTMRQTEERISRGPRQLKRVSRIEAELEQCARAQEGRRRNRYAHIWNKIPASMILPPLSGLLPFPKAAEATPPPRPCTMSEMTSPVQKITLSERVTI